MDETAHHDKLYAAEETGPSWGSALFTAVCRRLVDRVALPALEAHGSCPNGRVLSLGSGNGTFDMQVGPHVGSVIGVEISAVAVARAQADPRRPPNVSFVVGDARELARVPGAPFDAVLAIAVLHHFRGDDLTRLLRSAASALRPGGIMVSVDPSARRLVSVLKPLVRQAIARYHSPDEAELHPAELTASYRAAGFTDVRARPVDFAAGALAWVAPRLPAAVVPPLMAVDSALAALPGVGQLASSFAVVARK